MKGTVILIGVVFAAFALAGCGSASNNSNKNTSVLVLSAHLNDIYEETKDYKIVITFSGFEEVDPQLFHLLNTKVNEAKSQFLDALPSVSDFPELKDRQFRLQLNFNREATTAHFISIHEKGYYDMGGAHPIPIETTLVYDQAHHNIIELTALFEEPELAREAFARYAKKQLLPKLMSSAPDAQEALSDDLMQEWQKIMLKMLDEGTQPLAKNYQNFIVVSGSSANLPSPGLRFVFPPYQVAAYVYGTQVVDVPSEVFYQWLKPQYQDDFVKPSVNADDF